VIPRPNPPFTTTTDMPWCDRTWLDRCKPHFLPPGHQDFFYATPMAVILLLCAAIAVWAVRRPPKVHEGR